MAKNVIYRPGKYRPDQLPFFCFFDKAVGFFIRKETKWQAILKANNPIKIPSVSFASSLAHNILIFLAFCIDVCQSHSLVLPQTSSGVDQRATGTKASCGAEPS